jgi:hypothetical protein
MNRDAHRNYFAAAGGLGMGLFAADLYGSLLGVDEAWLVYPFSLAAVVGGMFMGLVIFDQLFGEEHS